MFHDSKMQNHAICQSDLHKCPCTSLSSEEFLSGQWEAWQMCFEHAVTKGWSLRTARSWCKCCIPVIVDETTWVGQDSMKLAGGSHRTWCHTEAIEEVAEKAHSSRPFLWHLIAKCQMLGHQSASGLEGSGFSPLMLHNAVTLISTRGFWEDGDEDSGCEEMEPNPFEHVHLDFVS